MLKIAVCDDERSFTELIEKEVKMRMGNKFEEIEIFICHSGNELLEISKQAILDVVFLDISMPDMDGFETAKKLLSATKNLNLIFVSNNEHLVFSSYQYRPLWFVPKKQLNFLDMAIDKIIEKIENDKLVNSNIPLVLEKKVVELDVNNVTYFKTDDHYIKIFYRNEKSSELYRDKLVNIEKQIKNNFFVRTHNRYIVNCRMISYIENTECVLHNSVKIPISRVNLATVKEEFHKYMRSIR